VADRYFGFTCSKSYCPFCVRVKQLFEKLGATFKAIEMDVESKCSKFVCPFQGSLRNSWAGGMVDNTNCL
jgi:hypothetical protein